MIRKKPITGGRFKTEFAYHRSTFAIPGHEVGWVERYPKAGPGDFALAHCHRVAVRRRTDGAGRLVITSSFTASVGPDLTHGAGGSLWAPPIVGTDAPGILGLTAHARETLAVRFLHPEQQHSFSC